MRRITPIYRIALMPTIGELSLLQPTLHHLTLSIYLTCIYDFIQIGPLKHTAAIGTIRLNEGFC